MQYELARPQILSGDMLLVRGSQLYSRIIQRWTKSVYSHVGVAIWLTIHEQSRLCIIEAMEGAGIRILPLRTYLERGYVVDWYRVTDDSIDRLRIAQWAADKWDKRYASPRQLIRSFVTAPLCAWLGLPTRLDSDRWFCSWFAAQALRAGGWQPAADDPIKPELTSPGDVALFTCLQRQGPLVLEGW